MLSDKGSIKLFLRQQKALGKVLSKLPEGNVELSKQSWR